MIKIIKTYYLPLFLILLVSSCRQNKYLSKNEFLLTKSTIQIDGNQEFKNDFNEIIRQKPNHKLIGIPIYLWVYNKVDSSSIVLKKQEYITKLSLKNKKNLEKQNRINDKRINKAIKRNKKDYKYKQIELKDTLNVKMSIKEWMKYRFGEAPVVFDSLYFNKSLEQLNVFLRKKGYYDANIQGKIKYNLKRNKVKTYYTINTGKPYVIDSIKVLTENNVLYNLYYNYTKNPINQLKIIDVFDSDKLDSYRNNLSRYFQVNGVYGFSPSNIYYIADTNRITKTVKLTINFTDRIKKIVNSDAEIITPFTLTKINRVYFHLVDTTYSKSNFKLRLQNLNLPLLANGFVRSLDTLNYINSTGVKHSSKKLKSIKESDSVNLNRSIVITYNGKLFVDANLLEMQNLTEKNTYYNIENYEKSVNNLIELGLFQIVKPEIIEVDDQIDVHYYLIPRKKMIYNSSARVTTSGVFLGFSGSANYTNTNLFRGAEKLVLSFTIGLQSMPNLTYNNSNSSTNVSDNAKQVFNTKEIGPSAKLELPGIFPFSISSFNKNQRAKTLLSSSFGFQQRNVFTKQSFKLNYIYNFTLGKNVELQFGFPGFSTINFINFLQFDETFKTNIYQNKDPFTQNYYRSQLNWQDFKFIYQYRNNSKKNSDKKSVYFQSTLDLAGNLLSLFGTKNNLSTENQKTILGISYSQFARIDNEFVFAYQLQKYTSFHFRTLIGGGLPYSNSKFALPFDYSFFGGGPNDIRAWRAGTLGPGSYNYYLDKNYTTLQLGDIRLGVSSEYRFKLSSLMRGAFFIDAGNVWTTKKDAIRIGSQFTSKWINEIAIASGLGLRADFDYFVVRLDYGFKLRNPVLSSGNRWFFQPKDKAVYDVIKANPNMYSSPFFPHNWNDFINSFRVGIGYPF